jgi:hypothetical protein
MPNGADERFLEGDRRRFEQLRGRRNVEQCRTLDLRVMVGRLARWVEPRHALKDSGIQRDPVPGHSFLVDARTQADQPHGASLDHFLGLGPAGRMEGPLVVRKARRRSAEHGDDLAADVDAVVIRIAHARRVHAESREHHVGRHRRAVANRIGAHDEPFLPFEARIAADLVQDDGGAFDIEPVADHRYLLVPASGAARFEAQRFELANDVRRGVQVARGARHAPVACVVGQIVEVGLQVALRDER